jgi:hypothetical protein
MSRTELRCAYSSEMPLSALDSAELFVLTVLRLWFGGRAGLPSGFPDWRTGLARADIDEAGTSALDALCRTLSASVSRQLDVRAIGATSLGLDEACVLRVLSCLQRSLINNAKALLCGLFPATAARCALEPAWVFAVALGARQLMIPRRPSPAAAPTTFQGSERPLQPYGGLRLN